MFFRSKSVCLIFFLCEMIHSLKIHTIGPEIADGPGNNLCMSLQWVIRPIFLTIIYLLFDGCPTCNPIMLVIWKNIKKNNPLTQNH